MEWTERTPLPTVCRHCTAKDCYNCDFAGARWQLSREEELLLRQKSILHAIARLERQLADIDRELERLQSEENAVQF